MHISTEFSGPAKVPPSTAFTNSYRVKVHWLEGCEASPCRTCAPSPMTLPLPTTIPSTWRNRCPATGLRSVSRQWVLGPEWRPSSRKAVVSQGLAWAFRPSVQGNAWFGLCTGYRAGGLHDSDTEEECWLDTEAATEPPARPRERPLSRSQSLRLVKRKPLTREVSGGEAREGSAQHLSPHNSCLPTFSHLGHFSFPQGSNKKKAGALRFGQLGSVKPGSVLPHVLQGTKTVWRLQWV